MTEKRKEQPNEQPPQKRRSIGGMFLRGLAVLIVLVIVFGLVTVSTLMTGQYRDRFQRWLTYGNRKEENLYSYSADNENLFREMGEYLVLVTRNSFQLLRSDGTIRQDISIRFSQPALETSDETAVVWDADGTHLVVFGEEGVLLERDEGNRLISVRLNSGGWMAVTEEKSGYKGAVTVYNQEQEKVFEFNSSSNFLIDAVVSRDGRRLLAVTMGQEEGAFVSNLLLYDLRKTEPIATGVLEEGVLLDLCDSQQGYMAAADEMLVFIDENTTVTGTYHYSDAYLRDYGIGGSDFAALLLGRYRAGSIGRLVTVGRDGKEIAAMEVTREVLDISAAGEYVAVLYSDELAIYHKDLTFYASTEETKLAGQVIMSEDGSALVISADSAWRFLP